MLQKQASGSESILENLLKIICIFYNQDQKETNNRKEITKKNIFQLSERVYDYSKLSHSIPSTPYTSAVSEMLWLGQIGHCQSDPISIARDKNLVLPYCNG